MPEIVEFLFLFLYFNRWQREGVSLFYLILLYLFHFILIFNLYYITCFLSIYYLLLLFIIIIIWIDDELWFGLVPL